MCNRFCITGFVVVPVIISQVTRRIILSISLDSTISLQVRVDRGFFLEGEYIFSETIKV